MNDLHSGSTAVGVLRRGRWSRYLLPRQPAQVVGLVAFFALWALLWVRCAHAEGELTREMIRALMESTDKASMQRDTAAIGAALGSGFYKYIAIPAEPLPATARMNKQQYLEMIERGWKNTGSYQYRREDVTINLSPAGDSGESFSTVIERFDIDGRAMLSKVREYARYGLENGRAVIVNIDSQTLVGDSTPE